MADCLTCEELELKICELADAIAADSCRDLKVSEGGITFDYSAGIKAKTEVLREYRQLYKLKCTGDAIASDALYEFVHVPCVKPATCVGNTCRTGRLSARTGRRYRR
jgi:hypothetical protein